MNILNIFKMIFVKLLAFLIDSKYCKLRNNKKGYQNR